MIAAAPTAMTMQAEAAPATAYVSAASAATAAGAIHPCRMIGFDIALGPVARGPRRNGLVDESIAAAANRLDHSVGAKWLERNAQPPDVHVDRSLFDVDVIAPDEIEQLRATVHALRPRHEQAQESKLCGSERNFGFADHYPVLDWIERQRTCCQHLLRRFGRLAPQDSLDSRPQPARAERLRDVIVDQCLEACDLVAFVGACRHHDDWQLTRPRFAAKLPRKRKPRLTRQHPVEQHQIGKPRTQRLLGPLGVDGFRDVVARIDEIDAEQFHDRRLVLDDEDRWHHRSATSARISSADAWRTSLPRTT